MPLFHVSRLRGLKHCVWIALAFILARACMNSLTTKTLQKYKKKKGLKIEVDKLQEEIWLVVCGTALSLFSGYLIASRYARPPGGPPLPRCVQSTDKSLPSFSRNSPQPGLRRVQHV